MLTKLFRKLSRSRKDRKEKLSLSQRRDVELLVIAADPTEAEKKLPPQEFDMVCFSVHEKKRLYAARSMIKFLPSTVSGGVVTQTAKMMDIVYGKKVSKQYVHQVLFPDDPLSLFGKRNITYKQIWLMMEQAISDLIRPATDSERRAIAFLQESDKALVESELLKLKLTPKEAFELKEKQELRDKYRKLGCILSNLAGGNAVVVIDADCAKIRYIVGKLERLGIEVSMTKDFTASPTSYVFTPKLQKEPWFESDVDGRMSSWFDKCVAHHGGIRVVASYTRILPLSRVFAGDEVAFGGDKMKIFHLMHDPGSP